MRVISGSLKGRKINSLVGEEVRPTSDRVKEALFNILMGRIESSVFLDLFAGTGNVGIEALSRGAEFCYFVDKNLSSIRCIIENINKLNLKPFCRILHMDAFVALDMFHKKGIKFDIIFLDPPYHQNLSEKALKRIASLEVLKEGGVVVAEIHKREELKERYGNLKKVKENRYGETILVFYEEEL
ncbi:16S rRNA (guanine(966)-N(2))-methyltransferase RsmD [Caldanaerobacter sp.]|uniref:16S rRNA (guanine(966)-N(2))-methyltransferase RsmD n=1 Tax=Caldanaerobacter sp. TaxID=2930036 RepID=UPI003C7332A9